MHVAEFIYYLKQVLMYTKLNLGAFIGIYLHLYIYNASAPSQPNIIHGPKIILFRFYRILNLRIHYWKTCIHYPHSRRNVSAVYSVNRPHLSRFFFFWCSDSGNSCTVVINGGANHAITHAQSQGNGCHIVFDIRIMPCLKVCIWKWRIFSCFDNRLI